MKIRIDKFKIPQAVVTLTLSQALSFPAFTASLEGFISNRDSATVMIEGNEFVAIDDMLFPLLETQGYLGDRVRLWPDGRIIYVIEQCKNGQTTNCFTEVEKSYIESSMSDLTTQVGGAVVFIPRSTQPNYLRIRRVDEDVTWAGRATVGYLRGPYMELAKDYVTSNRTVKHELLHVLGIGHEHQRPDRNRFISVKKSGHNYDQIGSAWVYTAYDFCSVMHYGQYDSEGKKWFDIISESPACFPGQSTMSADDIRQIVRMYGNQDDLSNTFSTDCSQITPPLSSTIFEECPQ